MIGKQAFVLALTLLHYHRTNAISPDLAANIIASSPPCAVGHEPIPLVWG